MSLSPPQFAQVLNGAHFVWNDLYPPITWFQKKCYGLNDGASSQTQVLKFNGKTGTFNS